MLRSALASFFLLIGVLCASAAETISPEKALDALKLAGTYFRDRLGVNGTYVWQYSPDGKVRRGEGGSVEEGVGWIQPPGTPAVGAAFLRIHQATGDTEWLDAAQVVASALVRTQLLSGGWFYHVDTDPDKAEAWCYRENGVGKEACRAIKSNRQRNTTVLDDDTTQGAVNFLMWFDAASGGRDTAVRDCIDTALERLMDVQYRNGAFPAFYSEGAPGANVEVPAQVSLPAEWSHEWVKPAAAPYLIVNDNLPRDTGRLFLNAYRLYKRPEYLETAVRIGDFLIAAQLPAPQRGWAQQYNPEFQPAWGRRFEPPALASFETAGSIDFLLDLKAATGEARFLEAARAAAEWLNASRLPDGSWARFYELGTDRPLYIDAENQVTFDDDDLLDHYSLREDPAGIEPTLTRLHQAEEGRLPQRDGLWISAADEMSSSELQAEVSDLVKSQDAKGRWVSEDLIDGKRFVEGVFALARFAAPDGAVER